jgi:hypothetical protein
MKMKHILVLNIVIFLFSISLLCAQNSGFMGKRVVFNVGTAFSSAWMKPNFADNPKYHFKWYSFNYTLSPNVEFIAWRMGIVGLSYHYFSTKYNYPSSELRNQQNDGGISVVYEDNGVSFNYKTGVSNLKSHGFGVFYKQYMGSKAYAPMGSYFKLQFDGFFYKRLYSRTDKTMVNDRLFAIKIEFGRDLLFFNILRLSTGVSLGVPFGGFNTMFFENYRGDGFFDTGEIKEMGDYAKGRILSHYWLGFTVGIGVIPF